VLEFVRFSETQNYIHGEQEKELFIHWFPSPVNKGGSIDTNALISWLSMYRINWFPLVSHMVSQNFTGQEERYMWLGLKARCCWIVWVRIFSKHFYHSSGVEVGSALQDCEVVHKRFFSLSFQLWETEEANSLPKVTQELAGQTVTLI
jgi:hypothetical protein